MITSAFLSLVYAFLNWALLPLTSLPDVVLPSNLSIAISTANNYLSSLDSFIPVGAVITILSTIVAIEVLILTYKLIMWVIKKIPTIN
jgi:hypothetical protein